MKSSSRKIGLNRNCIIFSLIFLLFFVNFVSAYYGDTWVAKDSNRNWNGIAMSSSGQYQIASVYGGRLYSSSDYGDSWSVTGPTGFGANKYWNAVAMSADGKYRAGAVWGGGAIYLSSDSGASWNYLPWSNGGNWISIAMSSDGRYQTALNYGGFMYTSDNYGGSWNGRGEIPIQNWRDVAMSSSGQYQTAVGDGGIYVSSNYGASWSYNPAVMNSVTMSSDGRYQTGSNFGRPTWSDNYGQSWTGGGGVPGYVTSLAMSAAGLIKTAVVDGSNKIFISTSYYSENPPVYWYPKNSDRSWKDVAMSADGRYQTAVVYGGQIYKFDFGSPVDSIGFLSLDWHSSVISDNGAHISVSSNSFPYFSHDTGSSWVQGEYGLGLISMSGSGQYQMTGNKFSTDYGNNWNWNIGYVSGLVRVSGDGQSVFGVVGSGVGLKKSSPSDGNFQDILSSCCGNGGRTYLLDTTQIITTDPDLNEAPAIYDFAVSDNGQHVLLASTEPWWNGPRYRFRVSHNFGADWNTVNLGDLGGELWTAAGISGNGQYMVIASDGVDGLGRLYVSQDSGVSWNLKNSGKRWESVAISDNGQDITALVLNSGGKIYVSHDSGNTWSEITPPGASGIFWWAQVAMSGSGQYQVATAREGYLYYSSDRGNTWVRKGPTGSLLSIAFPPSPQNFYRVEPSASKDISIINFDLVSPLRRIANNCTFPIFVPAKTLTEWNNFLSNHFACITITNI